MKQNLRILHLENDPRDAELIKEKLEEGGFLCVVALVEAREDYLRELKDGCFDLILADYTLPSFDGLSALSLAREICPDIPFIFISGTIGESRAIESLKSGATDYVLKDNLARLLPAVIRALNEARESMERRRAEQALKENEIRYRSLFENLLDGFAYCRMLFKGNHPQDFVYLHVNESFKTLTGLKDVVGKRVTEVIPGIREANPGLFEIYGRVASTGKPEKFEVYLAPLRSWLSISAYSTEKERFVAVFDNITERKRSEEALRASLEEKIVLLKEVHHRVKNNLQIVASLLSLQASRAHNPQEADILQDTRGRVHSMALLHEQLYRSGNLARINFSAYVKDLSRQLLGSFGAAADPIKIESRIAPVGLPLDQAVPCGLIINELLSNALKHAFPGGKTGIVIVELRPAAGKSYVLSVHDNGVGMSPALDPSKTSTLGLQLVSKLAGQLRGRLTMEKADGGGAIFSITFPFYADIASGSKS